MLKELFEPVQNASHNVAAMVYRLFKQNQRNRMEVTKALHLELEAWERLSDEALENFEKHFA